MTASHTGSSFRWQDGERLIVFGRGASAAERLPEPYVVLTTPRAESSAPAIVAGAREVVHVAPGRVDEIAASLRAHGPLLVALGGGRVIDVAKALAAASGGSRVAAVPTTLSGAEMTSIHRHATGVLPSMPRVRPAIVINDPALSASQPFGELASSAGNALGHAFEGPLTPLSNPVAALAARESVRLIAGALDPDRLDRDSLALAALLAGYVIGSTGYGLHHVLSQTLVRFAGVEHGAANSIMLPWSLRALAERFPGAPLDVSLAERVASYTGCVRLRDAGVSEEDLDMCASQAAARPELAMTPPAAAPDEIRKLYQSAY